LPAKRWPLTPVGLMVQGQLKGDFEVTGGFEIVDVPLPGRLPGAGVSMYYRFDTEPAIHGSMSWLNGPKIGTRYSGEVLWEGPGDKPRSRFNKVATTATTGRLQLRRDGETLRFLMSHGLEEPLIEFHRADVGTHDLQSIRFNATTIDQP